MTEKSPTNAATTASGDFVVMGIGINAVGREGAFRMSMVEKKA